ncbi:MAG: hypothetical protein WKF66_12780 [Pedobacter sp.]
MKTKLALIIMMTMLVGIAKGQKNKSKPKKSVSPRDSVYGYQIIDRSGSGNSLMLTMPIDTGRSGSVRLPNSYRKGGLEPVSMPTHKVEMLMLKGTKDSSAKGSVESIVRPNRKVVPVKPRKK